MSNIIKEKTEYNIECALKRSLSEVKKHKSGEKPLKPYSEYEDKWKRWAEEIDK